MSAQEPEQGDGMMTVAEITITRVLDPEGNILDSVVAADGDGAELGLAEALGMMRLAEDTLIRLQYGDGEDHGYGQ